MNDLINQIIIIISFWQLKYFICNEEESFFIICFLFSREIDVSAGFLFKIEARWTKTTWRPLKRLLEEAVRGLARPNTGRMMMTMIKNKVFMKNVAHLENTSKLQISFVPTDLRCLILNCLVKCRNKDYQIQSDSFGVALESIFELHGNLTLPMFLPVR